MPIPNVREFILYILDIDPKYSFDTRKYVWYVIQYQKSKDRTIIIDDFETFMDDNFDKYINKN